MVSSTPKVQYAYADGSGGTVRAGLPENQYDGRTFRVMRKDYSSGVLTDTRHFYYTSAWQVLEERVDSSSNPNRQFVWGLRYIDDCILRDRDTTGNGMLDERLYALQDGNWNVTAVCDENGDVHERYAYMAYGEPLFFSPGFVEQSGSSFGWQVLFTGQRWDPQLLFVYTRHRCYHAKLGCFLQTDSAAACTCTKSATTHSFPLRLRIRHRDSGWFAYPDGTSRKFFSETSLRRVLEGRQCVRSIVVTGPDSRELMKKIKGAYWFEGDPRVPHRIRVWFRQPRPIPLLKHLPPYRP